MTKNQAPPIYKQLIECITLGFKTLDPSTQNEITKFVSNQQCDDGGFMNRAMKSDPYYTLFGHWLSLATKSNINKDLLKKYITEHQSNKPSNIIEKLTITFVALELVPELEKPAIMSIIIDIFKNRQNINLAYNLFLLMLLIDAIGNNKSLFYFLSRISILFYKPGNNPPSSLLAALTYIRKKTGIQYAKQQSRLLEYVNIDGGFMSFKQVKISDMLSTAVSLFVLQKTQQDLRLIKPGCLNFIQSNYQEGAFLSGDGDLTKDLEYTFYGLLALGSLIKNE